MQMLKQEYLTNHKFDENKLLAEVCSHLEHSQDFHEDFFDSHVSWLVEDFDQNVLEGKWICHWLDVVLLEGIEVETSLEHEKAFAVGWVVR